MSQSAFLASVKDAIVNDDLATIQEYLQEARDLDFDWPFLFQKSYLHACLLGRTNIAHWLHNSVFPTMDPIQQIALRQIFSYGRHLLKKAARTKV